MTPRRRWAFGLVLLFSAVLAGCGSDEKKGSGGGGSGGAAGASGTGGSAGSAGSGGGTGGGGGSVSAVETFATVGQANEGLAFGTNAAGDPVLYVGVRDSNEVVAVDPSGNVTPFASIPSPLGIAVRADGDLLVCGTVGGDGGDEGVIWHVDSSGAASILVRGNPTPFGTTNYVAIAPDDAIVFSDSAAGNVYKADADGSNIAILTSLITFPNGLAFSEDGRALYVASWDTTDLWNIPRDPGLGIFGPPEVLSSTTPSVDGVVVMQNGDLVFVATSDGIIRLKPDGSDRNIVASAEEFMVAANGAFGVGAFGENTLYVTNLLGVTVSRLDFPDGALALPVR